MSTLLTILQDRLLQLRDRKTMIPRYVARPGKFLGKKDFSLNDLPQITLDIEETEAAIRGICEWKKEKRLAK